MIESLEQKTTQLIDLIQRMISIVKYDNQYAYQLLRSATTGKSAVIEIDECKVFLRAEEKEDYVVVSNIAEEAAIVRFKTRSATLQNIIFGSTTIDKAIAENQIHVLAEFADLLNVHRLAMSLLAEGSLNHRLRDLWKEFNDSWCHRPVCRILPIEHQKPCYDLLVINIPQKCLTR